MSKCRCHECLSRRCRGILLGSTVGSVTHLKLVHTDLKIIKHLSEAVIEAQLVNKVSTTVECKICMISKVKQIISCHSVICETKSYEQICWNLIHITSVYNQNYYISHFLYDQTLINHVYTQKIKIRNLLIIE